ncbi:MAG: OsmC family protein [Candidatus Omnitrophota bacterium]
MEVKVEYLGKRKFKVIARGHEVMTDLPEKGGGEDSAPTPSELFIGSIGSCAALYVARYLETAKLDPEGLSVDMDWEFSEDKSKISRVNMNIRVPNAELGARKKAVVAAANKCVIHQTLHDCLEININVEGE